MKENNDIDIELEENLNINQSIDQKSIDIINENANANEKDKSDINKAPNIIIKEKNSLEEEKIAKKTIKEYIDRSLNDPEYVNLIKENPQSLFSTVDEKKLLNWRKILRLKSPLTYQLNQNKDKEILSISLENIRKKSPVIFYFYVLFLLKVFVHFLPAFFFFLLILLLFFFFLLLLYFPLITLFFPPLKFFF